MDEESNYEKVLMKATRHFFFLEIEKGLKVLWHLLATDPDLTRDQKRTAREAIHIWTSVLDEEQQIASHRDVDEPHILHHKSSYLAHLGRKQEAVRFAWLYLQSGSIGEHFYDSALVNLIDHLYNNGNIEAAKKTTELLLSYHALADSLQGPDGVPEILFPNADDVYPCFAALTGIEEDGAECWVRLLEVYVEKTPEDKRSWKFCQDAMQALLKHYERTNDLAGLQRLQAWEPLREEAAP